MQLRWYLRRHFRYLAISSILLFTFIFLYFEEENLVFTKESFTDRELAKRVIDQRLKESLKFYKGTGCEIPKTDPFDEAVTKFTETRSLIVCDGFDWVRCNISKCSVRPEILKQFLSIECDYQDILFVKDNKVTLGPTNKVKNNSAYQLIKSDNVSVNCTGTYDDQFIKSHWKNYVQGIRKNISIGKEKKMLGEENADGKNRTNSYNVLLIVFDSAAKNAFIRLMPKSYQTLTEMGAVILNGYNIVGEGTPAAMFPILTGKNELELPDRRKGFSHETLDGLPFIFYKLREHGYRTGYFEDILYKFGGTFQYRFTGFRKQPADHYMRPFLFAVDNKKWADGRKYCIGDTPTYQLLLNASEQLFQVDGKKFLLTFISDITHDDIFLMTSADEGLARFLKSFKAAGHLEDTMLIVMGDHGSRFGEIRQTFLGKLEERLPLMAIMMPERLKRERPNAKAALKDNVNVLTTPHDLHATMLDVMDLRQYWNPMKIPGSDLKRGLTMLDPSGGSVFQAVIKAKQKFLIPITRSCSEAGIENHWCTCLKLENITSEDKMFYKTAEAFVNYINDLISFLSRCVPRTLKVIDSVQHYVVKKELLQYKAQKGKEGYLSLLTSNTTPDKETYLIKVGVSPGYAVYEATVEYYNTENKFVTNIGSISRINAYGDEPNCIRHLHPHLNMFCYCKK